MTTEIRTARRRRSIALHQVFQIEITLTQTRKKPKRRVRGQGVVVRILLSLFIFIVGCTRENSSSSIRMQLPDKVIAQAPQFAAVVAGSRWGLNSPTTVSEIDCYGIFLRNASDSGNACYNSDSVELTKLGKFYGQFEAGSLISIDAPSASGTTIEVLGFNSAGACSNVLNLDFNSSQYSAPLLVGKKTVDLVPGTMSVDITVSTVNAPSIETCTGPLFAGLTSGTWPKQAGAVTPVVPSMTIVNVASPSFAGSTGSVVVDSLGNVYYGDVNGYVIKQVTPGGVVSVFAGSGSNGTTDGVGTGASFLQPALLAIDVNDNIYVGDAFIIRKITPAAVVTTMATLGGGWFKGLTADNNGNVYTVLDDGSATTHLIQKISSGGTVTVFAGSSSPGYVDAVGASAQFFEPNGLVADSLGNVFVADTGNFRIRKITPAGVVTTFAGSGLAGHVDGVGTAAKFFFGGGYSHMSINAADDIFVGDMSMSTDNSIRKISSSGTVSTYCGTGSPSSNTGAAAGSIWSRFGLGVQRATSLVFFADNGSISKVVEPPQ